MYSKQTVLCSIAINKINFNVCFEKRQWNAIPFNFVFFFRVAFERTRSLSKPKKERNEQKRRNAKQNRFKLSTIVVSSIESLLFTLFNSYFL